MLTNQLKEWISYRELNVMEETFVVNECKEDACFVSMDFNRDLEIATSVFFFILFNFYLTTRDFIMGFIIEKKVEKITFSGNEAQKTRPNEATSFPTSWHRKEATWQSPERTCLESNASQ